MTRRTRRSSNKLSKSAQMARVRSQNTDAEWILRRALWSQGLRYRVLDRTLPGTPDLSFRRAQVAVFVDGCFWHGCPEHYTAPKAHNRFWREKLRRNRERDRTVGKQLAASGWCAVRVWEHELYEQLPGVVERIQRLVEISTELRTGLAQRRTRKHPS